jgi:hypothetical protein
LSTYFIGAVLLKSIAGSESLCESISSTIYGDRMVLLESETLDFYKMGSILFFIVTLSFTFGNIEGANRILQSFSSVMRLVVIMLFILGCLYSIMVNGVGDKFDDHWDFDKIKDNMGMLIGNTVFMMVC